MRDVLASEVAPIGSRWLVEDNRSYGASIAEVEIVEWAPSGLLVCLRYRGMLPVRWVKDLPTVIERLPDVPPRPTIAQLEAILASGEDVKIEIAPNGEAHVG